MFDLLPKSEQRKIEELAAKYGRRSMDRFYAFLANPNGGKRPGNSYIYPGLCAKPWHSIDEYPAIREDISAIERNVRVLQNEFNAYNAKASMRPYATKAGSVAGWNAVYLYEHGVRSADLAQDFPGSFSLIDRFYAAHCYQLSEVIFSVLAPHCVIPAHRDPQNFTMSLHVAVKVPAGCGIRVERETRNWQEGKALLFDYSFEHEVWNHSDEHRVVLIADLWHPDLRAEERAAIEIVFRWIKSMLE